MTQSSTDGLAGRMGRAWQKVADALHSLYRHGREAVIDTAAPESERLETIAFLRAAAARRAALPEAYGALFEPDPVSDPALAENRTADLASLAERIEAWHRDRVLGLCAVIGPAGSGRTSLLRLAERAHQADYTVSYVALTSRPESERELAGILARALSPGRPFEGDLEALAHRLRAAADPDRVVLLDDLEMTLLQLPFGTRLVERLTRFFRKTDDQVFWCFSISDLAWQYLAKVSTIGFVPEVRMTPWSPDALRAAVRRRHEHGDLDVSLPPLENRSGDAPDTRDLYATVLTVDHGQSPAACLDAWVSSLSGDGEGWTARPVGPLPFRFLEGYETDTLFALRAFLLHRRLTPVEHARVFRADVEQSVALFSHMRADSLIVPCESDRLRITDDAPHELNRLALGPIWRVLRERRYVY